jgi:hypothetical protein
MMVHVWHLHGQSASPGLGYVSLASRLGTCRKGGEVCENPRMTFGGLHGGPWEILVVPVVMMLLFVVILVRMYSRGHR